MGRAGGGSVADNARFPSVLAGADGIDPRQREVRVGDYLGGLDDGVRGLRVGVLREGFGGPDAEAAVDRAVRTAADSLRSLGAVVEDVSVPLHALGPAQWTAIAIEGMAETVSCATRASASAATTTTRWTSCSISSTGVTTSPDGRRTCSSSPWSAATSMRSSPTAARPEARTGGVRAAIEMSANACPFNITHHPALSLPCGTVDGLPVGMQIVGRHFDEATIYRAAHTVETQRAD